MMEKVRQRGLEIAEQQTEKRKSEIKSALESEMPGEAKISETSEDIVIQSNRLNRQLIENSSLRDVAFLMRGVR